MFRELLNINFDDDRSPILVCRGHPSCLLWYAMWARTLQCNATTPITLLCIANFMVKLSKISWERGHCRLGHDQRADNPHVWPRHAPMLHSCFPDKIKISFCRSWTGDIWWSNRFPSSSGWNAMLEGLQATITNTIQGQEPWTLMKYEWKRDQGRQITRSPHCSNN